MMKVDIYMFVGKSVVRTRHVHLTRLNLSVLSIPQVVNEKMPLFTFFVICYVFVLKGCKKHGS